MPDGATPRGSAAPSMTIEPGYSPSINLSQADDPEGAWTAAARAATFSRDGYATAQSYEYGSVYPQFVTWDYASAFLYAHPAGAPYPYVLVGD